MDIFEKIDALNKKGIIIDVVAINQIDNGYRERVKDGTMPLITYTVEVMNESLEMLYTESCASMKEALEVGINEADFLIPKQPKGVSLTHEGRVGNCPVCKKLIREIAKDCDYCGQKLDWD